jgi:hypothetical protein
MNPERGNLSVCCALVNPDRAVLCALGVLCGFSGSVWESTAEDAEGAEDSSFGNTLTTTAQRNLLTQKRESFIFSHPLIEPRPFDLLKPTRRLVRKLLRQAEKL